MSRPPGVPNVFSAEIKKRIELVFESIGGVKTLAEWASANPALFYTAIWAKLIPKDLNVSGEVRHSLESMILGATSKKQEDERLTSSH